MAEQMAFIPPWLAYLLAGTTLAVSALEAAMLLRSVRARRSGGRDVAVSHLAMGVAMAGMFVPAWAFGPSVLWELLFGAFVVWFSGAAMRSARQFGPHVAHGAVHALMSLAMVLMYSLPVAAAGSASMSDAAGGATSTPMASHDPGTELGVALLIVVLVALVVSAVWTVASPHRGASHFGACGADHLGTGRADGGARTVTAGPGTVELIGADALQVAMCMSMGFLLIITLPH